MKERPILFSAPMVRAILEGRKTQTRRVVKFEHAEDVDVWASCGDGSWEMGVHAEGSTAGMGKIHCPYGVPGDQLWVRETFQGVYDCKELPCCEDGEGSHLRYVYRATEPDGIEGFCRSFHVDGPAVWRPSIFMPRQASRLTLEVTGIRVERLQDISEKDATTEGSPLSSGSYSHRSWFRELWDSLYRGESDCEWADNPWVWVVEFKRIEAKSERGAA